MTFHWWQKWCQRHRRQFHLLMRRGEVIITWQT